MSLKGQQGLPSREKVFLQIEQEWMRQQSSAVITVTTLPRPLSPLSHDQYRSIPSIPC